jgi:hypothetical protein
MNSNNRNQPMTSLEINGTKYLICKLPNQPFSTLHDPATNQIVGQWNNNTAQYEIFPVGSEAAEGRGAAFTFV